MLIDNKSSRGTLIPSHPFIKTEKQHFHKERITFKKITWDKAMESVENKNFSHTPKAKN